MAGPRHYPQANAFAERHGGFFKWVALAAMEETHFTIEWATAARFRFGASSLLGDVIRVLGGTATEPGPDTY